MLIAEATVTAIAVVIRYIAIVVLPIEPSVSMYEIDASPTTIEKKTRGTTSIFISLMNKLPLR